MKDDIDKWHYEEVAKEIYVLLRRYTDGNPKNLIEFAGGDGFEAYRVVNRNCDDHASGRVSQLREECTKIGHHRCKDNKELGKAYQKLVIRMTKYRKAAGKELDKTTVCDIFMKMVPVALRLHLVFNEMEGDYNKVRDLMEHVLSEDGDNTHSSPVLSLAKEENQEEEEEEEKKMEEEQLNQFGGDTRTCHRCGKVGRIASKCRQK